MTIYQSFQRYRILAVFFISVFFLYGCTSVPEHKRTAANFTACKAYIAAERYGSFWETQSAKRLLVDASLTPAECEKMTGGSSITPADMNIATRNQVGATSISSSRSAGIDEVLKRYGASQSSELHNPNPTRDLASSQRSTDLTLDEILKLQQIVNNAFGSRQSRPSTTTSREQLSCTQNGWLLQCNRGREQVSCTRNGWLIQCNDGTSCNINGNAVTCNK